MEEEQYDYAGQALTEINARIRNLEEKQRTLKDRLLLIGQNLIEIRKENNQNTLEIKKDIETTKQNMERVRSFLETASSEFTKFAKKEDLEILSKQAKMLKTLKLIKK